MLAVESRPFGCLSTVRNELSEIVYIGPVFTEQSPETICSTMVCLLGNNVCFKRIFMWGRCFFWEEKN